MSVKFRLYLAIAECFGIVFVLRFLYAMFAREAVKRDLRERGCEPLHVCWYPLAFWAPTWRSTPFRVTYNDPAGYLHRARCYVYISLMDSPFGPRRVKWVKDELQ